MNFYGTSLEWVAAARGGRWGGATGPCGIVFVYVFVHVRAQILCDFLDCLVPHRMLEFNESVWSMVLNYNELPR